MKKLFTILLLFISLSAFSQSWISGATTQGQFGIGYTNLRLSFAGKGNFNIYSQAQVDSLFTTTVIPYTAGYGLLLSGHQFKADSTILVNKTFYNTNIPTPVTTHFLSLNTPNQSIYQTPTFINGFTSPGLIDLGSTGYIIGSSGTGYMTLFGRGATFGDNTDNHYVVINTNAGSGYVGVQNGDNSESVYLRQNNIQFLNPGSGIYKLSINAADQTANNTQTFQNKTGTVADLSDVPGGGGGALQTLSNGFGITSLSYNGNTAASIIADSTVLLAKSNYNTTTGTQTNGLINTVDTTLNYKYTTATGQLFSGATKLTLNGMTVVSGNLDATGSNDYTSHTAYVPVETMVQKLTEIASFTPIAADGSGNIAFFAQRNSYLAGTTFHLQHYGANNTDSLKICLWDNKTSTNTPTYSYALPFSIAVGYTYLVNVTKVIWGCQVQIIRSDGLQFTPQIIYQNTTGHNFGDLWGYPTVGVYAGHVQVNKFFLYSPYNRTPILLAFGDSLMEGNALAVLSGGNANCYINMVASRLGADQVAVCARGGESTQTILTRFSGELDWYTGTRYVLVGLGANDSDTTKLKTNLLNITDSIIARGAIPIVATIPPRADAANNRAWVVQMNNYIRTTIAAAGAKIFDLSYAVTVNGAGLYDKPGYCMPDSTHFTLAGNQAIYNRLLYDVPGLLSPTDSLNQPKQSVFMIPQTYGVPALNGARAIAGGGFAINATSGNINYYQPGVGMVEVQPLYKWQVNAFSPSGQWNFTNSNGVFSSISTAAGAWTADRNTTVGNNAGTAGFNMNAHNGSGIDKTYAQILGYVVSNTNGAESGAIQFRTPLSGTLATRAYLWPSGNVTLGNLATDIPGTTNSIRAYHIVGGTGVPTVVAGTGAGTSPTVTVNTNSTDMAGSITVTTGSSPSGSNAVIATITFNSAYGTAPFVTLTPSDINSAALSGTSFVFVPANGQTNGTTTTTFVLESGSVALAASTTYTWTYKVTQ